MMIQIVSGTFISVDLFIHYGSVTNKNELWISMFMLHWTFYWVPQCFSSTCFILIFSESPETKVFTFAFWDLNFPYSLFHILLVLGCHTSLTAHISSHYHTHTVLINCLWTWLRRPPWAEATSYFSQEQEVWFGQSNAWMTNIP